MFGLQLILTLAVMGGIIAFIGDNLGYKLGKRRLSVFGLRPRHTSTLMTVVSGVFIAALTLSALAVVSDDVRAALFGMEKLQASVEEKNRELDEAHGQLSGAREQMAALDGEIARNNAERDRITALLTGVQADKSRADAELQASRAESRRLLFARDNLQAEIKELEDMTQSLREGLLAVREGQVAFRAGQVLYAGVLRAGQDENTTVRSLEDFLAFANRYVTERLKLEDKDAQIITMPRQHFAETAMIMMKGEGPVAARLQAAGNILAGEPVVTVFALYPNKLVYKSKQAIYTEKITAPLDRRPAEAALVAFLSRLNRKAVADGLLPDPISGNVGDLEMPYMIETVEKMSRAERAFTITAEAERDIYTLGPLRVTLKIADAL